MDVCLFNAAELVYLLLAPCPGQFTVRLYYNQLARISISLNTSLMQKTEGGFTLGPPILTYWWITFFTPWCGRYCCRAATCAWNFLISFSLGVLAACVRAVLSVKIVMNFSIFLFSLAASFCTFMTDRIDTCLLPAFYVGAKWVKSSMSWLSRIPQLPIEVASLPCHVCQHRMFNLTHLAPTSKAW